MNPAAADALEILDGLPDAVVVLEDGPVVTWANRAAGRLLGVDPSTVAGTPCRDALPLVDLRGLPLCASSPIGRRMTVSRGLPEREYELRRGSEFVRVSVRCAYVKDDHHVVRRAVCTIRDTRARQGMDLRTVEMISTVSHEIRSPLTSVKGFTKMLLDRWDRFDDAMRQDMLRAVDADADRVTRLLTELLDVSRLEAGRLKLRPQLVDVLELVTRVTGKLDGRSEAHTLATKLPKTMPRVFADPDKLEQVMTNLLENAIKYTAGGTVTVTARSLKDRVRVVVADQGEGIPPAQLGRLFRKFFSRERAGSPSGTGLGLYIAKGLIEAHGGTLTAASVPGKGTTFTFEIPKDDDVPA